MIAAARVAAAIEILHDMAGGLAAEQALTRWARRSRFAGSKDRAAIRDHVFDVLRCRRIAAHFGRSDAPRALMIGLLHLQGADLDMLFSGEGHGPAPLSAQERDFPEAPTDQGTLWNLPDWLIPRFEDALGKEAEAVAYALQQRAPVFLRVNSAKAKREEIRLTLLEQGVETKENPLCDTALTVIEGARKIRNSPAYQDGLVELQDAASQAVVAQIPPGNRVLDYCAGGGGKALALAAQQERHVFAHDIDPRRMSDLPARAARAGVNLEYLETQEIANADLFDIVLCDAPCSGSGAWRRAAEGKWTLTQARLTELTAIQDDILDQAASYLAPKGVLVFATCSVLREENEARVNAFLSRNAGWRRGKMHRYSVASEGDGFFATHLIRDK